MSEIWNKIKYNRFAFFLSIVWRKWEPHPDCKRIDIKTAWEVANIVYAKWENE